jgi:hypothetical protein
MLNVCLNLCHRLGGPAAVLICLWLGLSGPAAAQSRSAAVGIARDEIEPCLSFDPSGALAECVDTGSQFEGIGRASVPAGGSPTIELSAGASIQTAAAAPLFQSVGAQAMLQDQLTLAGSAATARVTLVFRVSGALFEQSPPDATATVQIDVAGQGMVWSGNQSIDETVSATLELTPGVPQEVTILAAARATMSRAAAQSAGGAAGVGAPHGWRIRLEGVRIVDAAGAPIPGASLVSELGYTYPALDEPPPGLLSVGPATLWIGVGHAGGRPPLDLRVEVYRNAALVASGELRCLGDLADRPNRPDEVQIALGEPTDPELAPGDVLSLRVLARIGTNPDDTVCAGHRRGRVFSDGVWLYYDAADRPARLAIEIGGAPPSELFLRSDGGRCTGHRPDSHARHLELDPVPPAHDPGKCLRSGRLDLDHGNPWREVGTWSMTLP